MYSTKDFFSTGVSISGMLWMASPVFGELSMIDCFSAGETISGMLRMASPVIGDLSMIDFFSAGESISGMLWVASPVFGDLMGMVDCQDNLGGPVPVVLPTQFIFMGVTDSTGGQT
jgi:hypothetical protein